VQVRERLLELGQARNPHLGRREGVHPGDETDAVLRRVGFEAQIADGFGRGQHRLENHLHREMFGSAQRRRNFAGMFCDLLQCLGTV